MNREMFIGVDELTVVLLVDKFFVETLDDWEPEARRAITEFSELANLEDIFGKQKELDSKLPQGYTTAYQYGDNPFYFAVAYHPLCPNMDVIVKFSAYSWAVYCQKGQTNIKKFLDSIQSEFYSVRLSRVDFTVDYQNWDISVDSIYQNLLEKKLEIHDCEKKINHSKISAYEVDGKVSTFYVGSRKTGTRLFLRVYDKKTEQIKQKGFRLKEALNTDSWVRFEVVFKGVYAHQLTEIIMKTGEEKLKDLIADKVAEKYRFYDLKNEEYTNFTTALCEESKKNFSRLRLESPRDNDFTNSLIHLVNGSGLFSTMYKCDAIWGRESSMNLLKCLYNVYKDGYKSNDDVRLWLKKHKGTLAKQSLEDNLKLLNRYKSKR